MPTRRLVTGNDANGHSRALFDGPSPFSHDLGPFLWDELWTTDTAALDLVSDDDPADTDRVSVIPSAGHVSWRVITIQPDTDAGTVAPEAAHLIDQGDSFDGDTPWHTTDTIDFGVVLSGKIDLELDDGLHTLESGDCVVQRRTNHAWFNRYTEPCVMSFVMLSPTSSPSQATG